MCTPELWNPKGSAKLAIEWTKTGDGAVAGLSTYERFNLIHAPRRSVTISIQQDGKDCRPCNSRAFPLTTIGTLDLDI